MMTTDQNDSRYCESYVDSVITGDSVFVLGNKILNDDGEDCKTLQESMCLNQTYNITTYIEKFESNNLSGPTATFTIAGDQNRVYGRSIVAHPMGDIILCGSIWGGDDLVTVVDDYPDYSNISGGSGGDNSRDMFIARFDGSLNLLWSKRYSFGEGNQDICYDVGVYNEGDEENGDAVYIYTLEVQLGLRRKQM